MLHFRSPDIGLFGRRQRHARGHRIPVTIVPDAAMSRHTDAAIIVDEFGKHDVAPVGTCACCTVRLELQDRLRRLLVQREQRHITSVVIETGNDLGPILRTFATERALNGEFYVEDAPPLAGTRFELTEATPLPWKAFSRFTTTLQALRGADLLHAKGLLNIAGCRGPVVVQFVQHLTHPPVELQAWPGADRRSRLEFITRNIEKKTVRVLFDAVRALG